MKKSIKLFTALALAFILGLNITSSVMAVDDYPYANANMNQVDPWNYYCRNCTSFVAFRLNNRNGIAFHNRYGNQKFGNANTWGNAARQLGITVDNIPAVGAVAWYDANSSGAGTYGHVAWVSAVNGSDVTIEEYNYMVPPSYTPGLYNTRVIKSSSVSGFIHFKDIISPPPIKGWIKNATDNSWKYYKEDGSQVVGWHSIDNKWYYFNNSGIMQTGWQNIGGEYYYLYDNGEMATGWLKYDSDYYYLNSKGKMCTDQWIKEGNKKYYVGNDGKMFKNMCSTIDGIEYDFSNDGVAKKIKIPETTKTPEIPETTKTTEIPETSKATTEYSFRTRTRNYKYKTSESPNLEGWEYVGTTQEDGNWSEWSEWSTEYRENSENIKVEQRTVDTDIITQKFLGRYYSKEKEKFSPSKLDNTYEFEGGWFNEDDITFIGQAYNGGRTDCYTVSGYNYYFFEIGSHGGETRETSSGSQREYRYKEKTIKTLYKFRKYEYSDWSNWSPWSETPVSANDLTEVKTR